MSVALTQPAASRVSLQRNFTKEFRAVSKLRLLLFLLSITLISHPDGIRQLDFNPKQRIYQVGETITLSASGHPAPNFEWVDTEAKKTTSGANMRVTKRMTGRYQLRLRAFNTIPVPAPYNTSKEILITLIVEEYPGGNTYKRAQRIRVHVPTKIRYLYGPTMPTLVAVITYARFCRRVCKMTSRCFCGLLTHCLPTSGTVCLRHALTATSRTVCLRHAQSAYVMHCLPTSRTVYPRHALSA